MKLVLAFRRAVRLVIGAALALFVAVLGLLFAADGETLVGGMLVLLGVAIGVAVIKMGVDPDASLAHERDQHRW